MTHRSPLVTLAVVAAYFIVLLIANFIVNPGGPQTASAPTTIPGDPVAVTASAR